MNQLLMRRRAAMAAQEHDYLKFTALANNSSVAFWFTSFNGMDTNVEYRINGGQWTDKSGVTPVSMSQGDVMEVRRKNTDPIFSLCYNSNNYSYIKLTGSIAASGNVMSLIDKTCTQLTCGGYCFYGLFMNQSALVTPPYLPAVNVDSYGYQRMFSGCTNLVEAPYVQGRNLGTVAAYRYMFSGCSSLKSVRIAHLPSYEEYMFPSSLETLIIENTIPPLPATTNWAITELSNTCKIYVPWSEDNSILNSFKTANGWSDYAERIYELDEHGNVPQQINE